MNPQSKELKVGLTVFAAVAALAVLIIMFGKGLPFHFGNEYVVRVRFQRTPGISIKSPVLKNGVEIGKVSNVSLVDDDREVEVSISLPKKRKIYTDEECRVRQTVIMGDASLEFVKRPNYSGKIEVLDSDSPPLVGSTGGGLLDGASNIESDLSKAIENVSQAAVQVSELISRTNQFIGTPQELVERRNTIDSIAREMQSTLVSMHQMSDGVNLFINNPKFQENAQKIITALPEVLEQTQQLVGDAKKLLDKGNVSLDKIGGGLDKANNALEGIKVITDSISGDVPEVMKAVKNSSVKLETLFDELTSIVKAMNQADGTIKRLMRNPEAYEKLMETLDNVQKITGELDSMLQTDIKPITYNIKIITDKVARDPSVFIRNLLHKQPRTKPLPVWGDSLGSDTLGLQTLDRFSSETMYVPVCYEEPKNYQKNNQQNSQPNCFQRFCSGVASTFKGGLSKQCGNCGSPNCSGISCGTVSDETFNETYIENESQRNIPDAPKLAPATAAPVQKVPIPVLPKEEKPKDTPKDIPVSQKPLQKAPAKQEAEPDAPVKTVPPKPESIKPEVSKNSKTAAVPLILSNLAMEMNGIDSGVIIDNDPREQQFQMPEEKTAEVEPVLRFTR